jgi:hypothetical protein
MTGWLHLYLQRVILSSRQLVCISVYVKAVARTARLIYVECSEKNFKRIRSAFFISSY